MAPADWDEEAPLVAGRGRRLYNSDFHITVRGWHLAVACVLLIGTWHLHSVAPSTPSYVPGQGAFRVNPGVGEPTRAQPQPDPAATSTGGPVAAEPTGPPPARLSSVDSAALARELHRRSYGWDVLSRAGLRPSNFTPPEVLRACDTNVDHAWASLNNPRPISGAPPSAVRRRPRRLSRGPPPQLARPRHLFRRRATY